MKFKSTISQEVYQEQIMCFTAKNELINNISFEKSSQNPSILNSTDLPRKIKFTPENPNNLNDNEEKKENPMENELLEYTALKSELDRTFYRESLIRYRQNSSSHLSSSGLSFLSGVPKNENENTKKKYTYSFKIYKIITETLEKHLKDKENVLGFLLHEFKELSKKVAKGNLLLFKDEPAILQEEYESFTIDVRNFLEILQETLCLFYDLEKFAEATPEFVFLTKENLINFLTNHIFTSEFYELLLEFEARLNRFSEEKLQKAIFRLQNLPPKDFSIPKHFINPLKSEPFKDAINTMMTLSKQQSPLQKLKVILKTSDLALREIAEIYPQPVNGDDVLLIFLYIMVNSKLADILSQINLIEKYSGRSLLMTKSGYYFATVQICAKHLQEESTEAFKNGSIIQSLKKVSEALPSWKKTDIVSKNSLKYL